MSTHAIIARVNPDGTVDTIYTHHDGYLSHHGKILMEHYYDPVKVDALIGLGNLSVLGEKIGVAHGHWEGSPEPDHQCIAYGRDRGETNQVAMQYESLDELLIADSSRVYIFRDNWWWYWHENNLTQISPELFL